MRNSHASLLAGFAFLLLAACEPPSSPTVTSTEPLADGRGARHNPCLTVTCNRADGCRTEQVPNGTDCRLPNGHGVCEGGICTAPACTPGYGDCDGVAANGCEQDLT